MLTREGERMGSSEKQILSREWAIFRCIGSVEHPHTQSTYKICTSVNESEQTNGTEHCTCTPLVYMQIYMPYSTPLQYGMLCRAIQMIISPLNICTYILYKYIKADHGFIFMVRFTAQRTRTHTMLAHNSRFGGTSTFNRRLKIFTNSTSCTHHPFFSPSIKISFLLESFRKYNQKKPLVRYDDYDDDG